MVGALLVSGVLDVLDPLEALGAACPGDSWQRIVTVAVGGVLSCAQILDLADSIRAPFPVFVTRFDIGKGPVAHTVQGP